MSVAKPDEVLQSPLVYHQTASSSRISETRKILSPEARASLRPTTPVPSPFVAETHRPGHLVSETSEQKLSVSELKLRDRGDDRERDLAALRGKLRLRRSLPPKF